MDGGAPRPKSQSKTQRNPIKKPLRTSLVNLQTPAEARLESAVEEIKQGIVKKLRPKYKPRPVEDKYPATISEYIVQYGPEDLAATYQKVDEDTYTKIRKVASILQRGRIRSVFDPLDANLQCRAAIGAERDDSPCWLCGLTIKELGDKILAYNPAQQIWTSEKRNANTPNAPECEHIIPSAVAIQYFDVIASRKKPLTLEERTYFSLNYRWSHRRCNNEKSNLVFLKMLRTDNIYPDVITTFDEVIELYVKNLRRIFREQLGVLFDDSWEASRVKSIKDTAAPLIENLNNTYSRKGLLMVLANAAIRQERVETLFKNIEEGAKVFDEEARTLGGNHKTFRRKI